MSSKGLEHIMRRRSGHGRPGLLALLVGLSLSLGAAPKAEAQVIAAGTAEQRTDAVRIAGQWHENIRIRGIERGQLVYVSARGQTISLALAQLEGLRVARFPELAQGYEDLEAGRTAEAILALRKVGAAASDPWLQHLSSALLVRAYDRSGQGVAALTAYLALARGGADPALLSRPPVRSTEALPVEQKIRFLPRIEQALQTARHATLTAALGQLQAAAQWAEVGGAGSVPPITLPTPTPMFPVLNATAAGLLRAGRPAEALAALEPVLAGTEALDEAIYLQGRAQLALAEQSGDHQAFKTAALSFMRVVIHFPRSAYVGPALLEVGYAHGQWGDTVRRDRLYVRAAERLDGERDPATMTRLLALRAEPGS